MKDVNLPNKLCSAIIDSLNHRKNLLEEFKDVKEQVSVLEKVTLPCATDSGKRAADDGDTDDIGSSKRRRECDDDKTKPKPIALVSPRMHNAASPVIQQPGKRGRPKRKSRDSQSSNDISLTSDRGPRPSHHRPTFMANMPVPFHSNIPRLPSHYNLQNNYSVYRSQTPYFQESLSKSDSRTSTPVHGERCHSSELISNAPRSDPREYYANQLYHGCRHPRGDDLYDATRSLLQMNKIRGIPVHHHGTSSANRLARSPKNSEILNSSFPPHVSTTTPFWQQYSNLARTMQDQDARSHGNTSGNVDKRLSDGSTTDTASISSQEGALMSPASAKGSSPSPVRPTQPVSKNEKHPPVNGDSSPSNGHLAGPNLSQKDGAGRGKQNLVSTSKSAAQGLSQKAQRTSSVFSFITQSATASFHHLLKSDSTQNHSVGSLLTSRLNVLEKAALNANGASGRVTSSGVPKIVPGHAANKGSPDSKQGVQLQTAAQKRVSTQGEKSQRTEACGSSSTVKNSSNSNDILKQLGRRISLQKENSQSKVLLGELSVKSGTFSPPVMTYHQYKQASQTSGATLSEVRRQAGIGEMPSSASSSSVTLNSEVSAELTRGVMKTGSSTDVYNRDSNFESWSSAPPNLSAVRLPPELKMAGVDSSLSQSNMTIYKPGSASHGKSGRKGRNGDKATKSLANEHKQVKKSDDVNESKMKSNTTSAFTPIVPNPNGRVLCQNPMMKILPTHSRLLVIPNATSVMTTTSSFPTVLYINSQNSNEKTTDANVAISTGSNSVVSNPVVTKQDVASTVPTKAAVTNSLAIIADLSTKILSKSASVGLGASVTGSSSSRETTRNRAKEEGQASPNAL